jgi:ABC-2 type transport system permease protein
MRNAWLIFLQEFKTTVLSRSFLIPLIALPLVGAIAVGVISLVQRNQPAESTPTSALTEVFTPPSDSRPIGIVDQSGLVRQIPSGQEALFRQYPDEAQGKADLEAGRLQSLYIVPADYLQNGKMSVLQEKSGIAASGSALVRALITYNLLGANEQRLLLWYQPLQAETVVLQPSKPAESADATGAIYGVSLGVTMLLYMIVVISSSLMLSSVTKEKENRTIEILLTSVTPVQMLSGKLFALGLASLLQAGVWLLSGYFLLSVSGNLFQLSFLGQLLPPGLIVWLLIFTLLGFAVYAGEMGGVGALVPNVREGTQLTQIAIIPLVIPAFLSSAIANAPDGTLALVLSIFPLTSPVGMPIRLLAGQVPLAQLLVSVALLVLTVVFVIRGAARLFKAQYLLSGKTFGVPAFLGAFFGREPS